MKPKLQLVEDTGSQLEAEAADFELPPQQGEMPFAVVDGEPITQLPRDLYIPPDALQVFLEAFEGPLDLLLYLIRRQNLDILDIPIAEITRQYMGYIEVMSELQLELAGEYLLMAAMLAEIKSRMLLPRPPSVDGSEEEDPRAELVRRLQEYERFKQAAEDIDRLPRMERDTMPTSAELVERKVVKIMPQVTLQEMLLALKDVMSRAEMFAHHHVHRDRLSVRQRMSDILSNLRETAFVQFTQLFRAEEGRMGVTVTFSAILELMKEGLIEIVQAEPYAPLHVRPASGARHLTVVGDDDVGEDSDADAENQAALAQPAHPDENVIDDDVDDLPELSVTEDTAAVEASAETTEAVPESTGSVSDDNVTQTPPEEDPAATADETESK
ncbi:MAG TPA: ScpA family protein [Povalibacter sp.]|nr:ScpA family protein [Povalibacter sp.]